MITVIGTNGCGQCISVKNKLEQNNIQFEYKLFNTYSDIEQDKILAMAEEKGISSFPIIIQDGEIKKVKDILKREDKNKNE